LYCIDAARVVTGSKLVAQLVATENRRRPNEVSVRGTVNKSMFDERRDRSSAYGCYSGKKECSVLLL